MSTFRNAVIGGIAGYLIARYAPFPYNALLLLVVCGVVWGCVTMYVLYRFGGFVWLYSNYAELHDVCIKAMHDTVSISTAFQPIPNVVLGVVNATFGIEHVDLDCILFIRTLTGTRVLRWGLRGEQK